MCAAFRMFGRVFQVDGPASPKHSFHRLTSCSGSRIFSRFVLLRKHLITKPGSCHSSRSELESRQIRIWTGSTKTTWHLPQLGLQSSATLSDDNVHDTVRRIALLPIMDAKALTASLDQTPARSGLLPDGTMSTREHSIDISGSRRNRGCIVRILQQQQQQQQQHYHYCCYYYNVHERTLTYQGHGETAAALYEYYNNNDNYSYTTTTTAVLLLLQCPRENIALTSQGHGETVAALYEYYNNNNYNNYTTTTAATTTMSTREH